MKRPQLQYVKFVPTRDRKGWHAYFCLGVDDGKRVYSPLGLWGSKGFFDRYATLQGHRTRKAPVAGAMTVAGLIQAYERSEAYTRRAASTQKAYGFALARIRKAFGDFPVDDLSGADVRIALTRIDGNATRNLFVSVIGAIYKFGREAGLTTARPSQDIKSYETGEHEPWPADLIDAALSDPDDLIRRAVHLLYFTGQRIGDTVRLRWPERGFISLTQQKTGKDIDIPVHADLQAELDATPRRALTILADEDGRPICRNRLRRELQKWALGKGHKIVPHGLRKNAVIALLEAECTVPEVAAITGQTFAVVEYYARRVSRKQLASAAIFKLERKAKVQAAGKRANKP